MKITKDDLANVAYLSRLALDDGEEENYIKDLNDIVAYVDKLSELDTDNIMPTTYALATENVFREDEVRPSLTQEEALSTAPDKENGYFKVPQVLAE